MTTETFTGTGRGKATPKEQFGDNTEVDTEEDLPLVLEDAVQKPKEGKQGASKSKVKRQHRPQKDQRLLLRKPHRIPNPPNHTLSQPLQNPSQAQARLPPKTLPRLPPKTPPRPPLTKPPNLPPETLTKMNPQLPLSMSRCTKQQAKSG